MGGIHHYHPVTMPELFKNFGHDFWKPREVRVYFSPGGGFGPSLRGPVTTARDTSVCPREGCRGLRAESRDTAQYCSLVGCPQLVTPNVSSAKGEQPRNGSSPADTSWPPLMGQRGAAHFPGQTPTPASCRLLLPFPNSPSFRFLYDLLMSLSLCPGYDVWELAYPYLSVLKLLWFLSDSKYW